MFARLFAIAYLLAVPALGVAAVAISRTYCESFGCIGIGILWFAWAGSYGVVVLPGLLVYRSPALPAPLARACKAALVVQLLLGVGLAGLWVFRRFVV
jgi:hypothetical protein